MARTARRSTAALVLTAAVVLILTWTAPAMADPGQGSQGTLVYNCPYTGAAVTAAFDVTQLDDRGKGEGWATISSDYDNFSLKVKLARVDAAAGTAYFAGPTSESKYAGWWYFAVRAGTCESTGGAYGRYIYGPDSGQKADWVAEGYLGGFDDFQALESGWVTISG
ncbi:MAG: hypothetical protein ACYC6T_10595 [Thermoleophilia bacterium]